MNNYFDCITFVMNLEDRGLTGKVTKDSDGTTRFGLLDKDNPTLIGAGFYLVPRSQALTIARSYYTSRFWPRMGGPGINDSKIAAQLLSIYVNQGPIAINLIQGCVNTETDGIMGPETIKAINQADPVALLSSFNTVVIARYKDIAAKNPDKEEDLQGWLNRVSAIDDFKDTTVNQEKR